MSTSKIPDEIEVDGNTVSYSQDVTEKLNYFFSTISDKLKAQQTKLKPGTNADIDGITIKEHVHSKVPADVNFKIPLMRLPDLKSSIKFLDASKATGLDGITLSAEIISPSLLEIIDISLHSG